MTEGIIYQVEKASDVLGEIKPLLEEHYKEIALYQDRFPLRPDYGKYLSLEIVGMLHIVTARHGRTLIGYYISFIMPHLHYQDCIIAMNDIFFLLPEYRRGRAGIKMLAFAEQDLRRIGVHRMMLHIKVANDFSPVVKRMGFVETERCYEKLLDGRDG